jgi:hypothetical protein
LATITKGFHPAGRFSMLRAPGGKAASGSAAFLELVGRGGGREWGAAPRCPEVADG